VRRLQAIENVAGTTGLVMRQRSNHENRLCELASLLNHGSPMAAPRQHIVATVAEGNGFVFAVC